MLFYKKSENILTTYYSVVIISMDNRSTKQKIFDNDPELCLPVSVCGNLCDREPEKENEIIELTGRHIVQFFDMYSIKGKM